MNNTSIQSKIIIGIDPWGLKFNQDLRWKRNQTDYYKAVTSLLEVKVPDFPKQRPFNLDYIINLINPYYFFKSCTRIYSGNTTKLEYTPSFNYSLGYNSPVMLPDGSHVYSRNYIEKQNKSIVPIGGINYKIDSPAYSEEAISFWINWIEYLKQKEQTVIFMMTPYAPNVWKDKRSETTETLIKVEKKIRNLASFLNITVIGSYQPEVVGCDSNDFFDHMHPKDSCVSKIK